MEKECCNDYEDDISKSDEFNKFEDMNLSQNILRGIFSYGYELPSPIQSKAIPLLLKDQDVIAQSQSGTGKTAAFSISLLNLVENYTYLKGIILAPTRELATQIFSVISSIGSYADINICLCIGGDQVKNNIEKISEKNPQILVCTPGRFLDLIEKRGLKIQKLSNIIIDEADEMLSCGFQDQLYWILKRIPKDTKIALFSATMPIEVLDLTYKFMFNPVKILIKNDLLTLEGIKQYYVFVSKPEFKLNVLMELYEYIQVSQAIIYCNEKRRVDFLVSKLKNEGFPVSHIHGNMPSQQRIEIMNSFRKGDSRILITTDLLARGIDIQQVSLVINYEISLSKENYIHRIGRSGRFGRKGIAINLVTNYEVNKLEEIQRFYQTQIDELPSNISSIFD